MRVQDPLTASREDAVDNDQPTRFPLRIADHVTFLGNVVNANLENECTAVPADAAVQA